MESLRGLVVLVYYDRPNMVHNALNSIRELEYDNFHVVAIDDGSPNQLEPIVRMHYKDILHRFTFIRLEDTIEQKTKQLGSKHGFAVNAAHTFSDSDFAVILCDDDALIPSYFTNACKWFEEHPDNMYGYCHVIDYNPVTTRPDCNVPAVGNNNHVHPLNGECQIDSSQGIWRTTVIRDMGVRFPSPQTACLDACLYRQLYSKFGAAEFIGCFGQYKARFPAQLGVRGHPFEGVDPMFKGVSE